MESPRFSRISSDPAVLGGKPCIRGTRISVEFLLELVASGASIDQIVRGYPQLAAADVEEALRYVAGFLDNEIVISAKVAG
jgi:uncharacterized protein (DUF433 family)